MILYIYRIKYGLQSQSFSMQNKVTVILLYLFSLFLSILWKDVVKLYTIKKLK